MAMKPEARRAGGLLMLIGGFCLLALGGILAMDGGEHAMPLKLLGGTLFLIGLVITLVEAREVRRNGRPGPAGRATGDRIGPVGSMGEVDQGGGSSGGGDSAGDGGGGSGF